MKPYMNDVFYLTLPYSQTEQKGIYYSKRTKKLHMETLTSYGWLKLDLCD